MVVKVASSFGVGGKPVRSNDSRRSKVAASAGGDGFNPAASSFAKMNRSTGSSDQDGADSPLEEVNFRRVGGSTRASPNQACRADDDGNEESHDGGLILPTGPEIG